MLDAGHQQHKVRLSAIDAPERRQAYGERSKEHLASIAHGRPVRIVWERRDRYGRLVARVMLAQCARPECPYSVDAGLEQIKAGLAWHYKQYAKAQPVAERATYAYSEVAARARGDGLWRDTDPVPPWLYRNPGQTPIF
ncbi:MAG TPA: thermonuclease family protein [Burkholderiales bacterium]|nr:thermonuclease family protein [Burkholderiales bacterium]